MAEMTPKQAIENVANICAGLTGYTIQGVDVLRASVRVLQEMANRTPPPEASEKPPTPTGNGGNQ